MLSTTSETSIHVFKDKLSQGLEAEKVLDKFYSQWYKILVVSREMQGWGIDRFWTAIGKSSARLSVEYKTDWRVPKTRNAFIETVSVDTHNKAGWAYSSCSQLLIYFVPGFRKAYWMDTLRLKYLTKKWESIYPTAPAQNEGYQTLGLLVPFSVFQKECYRTDTIPNV